MAASIALALMGASRGVRALPLYGLASDADQLVRIDPDTGAVFAVGTGVDENVSDTQGFAILDGII